MRTLTLLISAIVMSVFTVAVVASLGRAKAVEVLDPVCQGVSSSTLCEENKKPQNKLSNSIYGKDGIITKAVRILSMAVGIAAVIAIIIGGLKYVMSTGDSNSVNSAKNTILYAVIGLVVSLLAQGIILFVLNKL